MKLNWEEWESEFKPIPNHFDDNASYDGLMFETYEPEYSYIKNSDRFQWTLIEVDGTQYIIPGLHYVNRLGYFLTEKGYHGQHDLFVIDDHDIFTRAEAIDKAFKFVQFKFSTEDLYEEIEEFFNNN